MSRILTVDALPPFWAAFSMTLTATVGAGTLALPIALAAVGPGAGIVLLAVMGITNLLTAGYMAEACARSAGIRSGDAYLGRVVGEFLGPYCSFVVRLSLFAFSCVILVAYYTGFAATLTDVSGVPGPYWVALLFAIGVFYLRRPTLTGTIGTALLISLVNVLILMGLSVFALGDAAAGAFTFEAVFAIDGGSLEPAILNLVFGVALTAYFGHISVSNCAQVVLGRDPSGRALKHGTMAAMAAATLIYIFWVFAVGTAVGADRLIAERGTALVPLAEELGTEVYVLGGVFVVLGLGMSSIHFSMGLHRTAREALSEAAARSATIRRLAGLEGGSRASLLALLPLGLVFLYAQRSFLLGEQSFAKPIEVIGALLTPIPAGLVPILLLIAARRRGLATARGALPRILCHPLVLLAIGLTAFAGPMLHALVIWTDPLSQAAAAIVSLVMVSVVVACLRRGSIFGGDHGHDRDPAVRKPAARELTARDGPPALALLHHPWVFGDMRLRQSTTPSEERSSARATL